MRKHFLFAIIISCVVLLVGLRAQDTSALPPEAQKEFDRGLAAAEQKQWDLAVRHFADAQKSARTSPQVLFNLGLAYGKAGHLLPGIVWLHAYLAAVPQAANADAVRKEITRLEVAQEAITASIIQQASDAASHLEMMRLARLEDVCEMQAASGDLEGAIRNQPQGRGIYETKGHLWEHYLISKAMAGDAQAVLDGLDKVRPDLAVQSGVRGRTSDEIREVENTAKCIVLNHLFHYQAEDAKDWDGASATIDKISQVGLWPETSIRTSRESLDSFRKFSSNRWDALFRWLNLAPGQSQPTVCDIDLDLETALRQALVPPVGTTDVSSWREDGGIVRNLLDVVDRRTQCWNTIQAADRALAWQASHPLTK